MLMALVLIGCVSPAGPGNYKAEAMRLDSISAPLLAQTTNMDAANTPILLKQADRPNASTDGKVVYITTGLMDRISDLALALIIAHELGHISLGHISLGHNWSQDPPEQLEQEADRYGLLLLARAGFDYREAVQLASAIQPPHKDGQLISKNEAKRAAHFRAIIVEIETLKATETLKEKGTPLLP